MLEIETALVRLKPGRLNRESFRGKDILPSQSNPRDFIHEHKIEDMKAVYPAFEMSRE